MRKVTLKHLESELRKPVTPLFQRPYKKGLDKSGKRVKKQYAELHYPTFVRLARPALVELIGNNLGDEKLCHKILQAMMFVVRGRRANHLQHLTKTGKPMVDIYSEDAQALRSIMKEKALRHSGQKFQRNDSHKDVPALSHKQKLRSILKEKEMQRAGQKLKEKQLRALKNLQRKRKHNDGFTTPPSQTIKREPKPPSVSKFA